MPINIKDSGTYKVPTNVYVKDSGSWKEAIEVFVNDGGTWKSVHTTGFNINTSTGYNSVTGITYSDVYQITNSSLSSQNFYKSIPSTATSVDFFLVGGGGGGGVPSDSSNPWIGSGGQAGMVIYGRIPLYAVSGGNKYMLVTVPNKVSTASSSNSQVGRGNMGLDAIISVVGNNTTTTHHSQNVTAPGGMGGMPGDGKHGRPMYQLQGILPLVLSDTSRPNVSFYANDFIDRSPSDVQFTSNGYLNFPHFLFYKRHDTTHELVANVVGASSNPYINEEDDIDSNSNGYNAHQRVVVWDQNTSWVYRERTGTSPDSFTVLDSTPYPLHPNGTFTATSTSNWNVTSIVAAPPERATGYAGTFRGETTSTSSGIPQNQSFSRTSGAQGTGSSITGWSSGAPRRDGASNGTGFGTGQGGSDGTSTYNTNTRVEGTPGIVMLKFNS